MLPRPFRVERVRREAVDVVTLALAPVDGGRFSFAPGQFNMLYAFGVGEVPVSMSGRVGDDGPVLHTVRAVGAVTRALCAMQRGATVGVRGPFGAGWPVGGRGDLVLVAGGIGLAPLRSAVYRALARRSELGHVALAVGARTPADLLFRDELARWQRARDVEVALTVDAPGEGWRGPVGVVTRVLDRLQFEPSVTTALVCGPEVMMRFAALQLHRLGVAFDRVFVSMERNMKCAIGFCGHCQLGPAFVCKDGPVFPYRRVDPLMRVAEL